MLSIKAEIEVQEMDAAEMVTAEIFDDSGKIVGMKPSEQYRQELEEMQGRVFFGLTVIVGEKAVRVHSEISSPPDQELPQRQERAHILSQGFAQIGRSIYLNFSEPQESER